MKIIREKRELTDIVDKWKNQGGTIGFVPTMGAIHEGHLSLVRKSVQENSRTVVSIFINPAQFNEKSDYDAYPRTEEADLGKLSEIEPDVIFIPESKDMYGDRIEMLDFDMRGLDKTMEGKYRPGHFAGVVTIVYHLFSIARPDKAYFGKKDYQQLAIIRLLAQKRFPSTQIVPCPIIREASGLAMSSRNSLLTTLDREKAAVISRVLFQMADNWQKKTLKILLDEAKQHFESADIPLEYLEVAEQDTLKSLENYSNAPAVICVAARIGKIRLIDNVELPC